MNILDIKNIIFDLGNVIINVDTAISEQEFRKQGINNFDELYSLINQSELFDNLEIGKISIPEFYDKFREVTNTQLSNLDIERCWNAMLLDYPQKRLDLLLKLKPKYRTFILSNTNSIHYLCYTSILKQEHNVENLESIVEKAYFSHEIGMKKPAEKIFNYVMKDSNLYPNETLFIDDNKDNIVAAEKIGIKTIWLKENNLEFLDIWDKLLHIEK